MGKLKQSFVSQKLRPEVKGAFYEQKQEKSEKLLKTIEEFKIDNQLHRKIFIRSLLEKRSELPTSTQKLLNIFEKIFPNVNNYV